jgi:outer membrane protein, heavy metal efflux system
VIVAILVVPIGGLPGEALGQTPSTALEALTLRAATALVAERNRDVQAARRALDAARADTIAAGARPNPNLTLGIGQINPQVGIGPGGPRDKQVDALVRLDQIIERGGKRELRVDAARKLEEASAADVADVLRQQRLAAASAYYDLVLAQDRVAVTNENVELFDRTLAAAEQRLRAGDIAPADLARLRVDALRGQNDARQAEAERVRARFALGYLIGAEAAADRIRAIDAWPALAQVATADLEALVERRPDVAAARARFDSAAQARELARRLRTRDISVGAQYDRYPTSPTNNLGFGNAYGFTVTLPLFLRYNFEGEIARAEADYFAAQDAIERTRAIARTELARARADLVAAGERLERFDTSITVEARRSAEFAEFAFRNGAIGVIDLLDARRVLRATLLDAAQARADYARALAAWTSGLAPASANGDNRDGGTR